MREHDEGDVLESQCEGRPPLPSMTAVLAGIFALMVFCYFGARVYFQSADRSATGAAQAAGRAAVIRWMSENSVMPEQVLAKIYKVAADTTDPDLVLAVCVVESNFNPRAKSDKGALGLMGIMPEVWMDELRQEGIVTKKKDLYTISGNIAAGAYVLEQYLSRSATMRDALIRYEGGHSWYATRVLTAMQTISLLRSSGKNAPLIASAR